jgi:hypothetical protein
MNDEDSESLVVPMMVGDLIARTHRRDGAAYLQSRWRESWQDNRA